MNTDIETPVIERLRFSTGEFVHVTTIDPRQCYRRHFDTEGRPVLVRHSVINAELLIRPAATELVEIIRDGQDAECIPADALESVAPGATATDPHPPARIERDPVGQVWVCDEGDPLTLVQLVLTDTDGGNLYIQSYDAWTWHGVAGGVAKRGGCRWIKDYPDSGCTVELHYDNREVLAFLDGLENGDYPGLDVAPGHQG